MKIWFHLNESKRIIYSHRVPVIDTVKNDKYLRYLSVVVINIDLEYILTVVNNG